MATVDNDTVSLPFYFATALLVVVATSVYYWLNRRKTEASWIEELTQSNQRTSARTAGPLKNIWDAASTGSTSSVRTEKRSSSGKPFGSSYYYAHNSSKSKGGYADGLKMEDYQMNQPRLLSRDGVPVENDLQQQQETRNDVEEKVDRSHKNNSDKPAVVGAPITKYLWDDPGEGVATITIDTLPGTGGSTVSWKDAKISAVGAQLENGGMVVNATSGTKTYQLRIRTLYGEVKEIKAISKPKRLIVKLYKKSSFLDKSNLKAWPKPSK